MVSDGSDSVAMTFPRDRELCGQHLWRLGFEQLAPRNSHSAEGTVELSIDWGLGCRLGRLHLVIAAVVVWHGGLAGSDEARKSLLGRGLRSAGRTLASLAWMSCKYRHQGCVHV
jgi:hypothetical protein